ncbi:MAG TPA: hypothetical protein VK515_05205 [Rhizomicrobium sp.]|nr:hypothetical protein [Rhizomicrobium sp.]
MADTRVQLEVEDWVRENWMQERFSSEFHRTRVKLSSGGVFDFDAVSTDRKIIASISTSSAKTSSGKYAVGKMMKLRSDMLFLLMVEKPAQKFLVLTEKSMYDACEKEKAGGRAPDGIEFILAEIPIELEAKLIKARAAASKEVSPQVLLEELPDEVMLEGAKAILPETVKDEFPNKS